MSRYPHEWINISTIFPNYICLSNDNPNVYGIPAMQKETNGKLLESESSLWPFGKIWGHKLLTEIYGILVSYTKLLIVCVLIKVKFKSSKKEEKMSPKKH